MCEVLESEARQFFQCTLHSSYPPTSNNDVVRIHYAGQEVQICFRDVSFVNPLGQSADVRSTVVHWIKGEKLVYALRHWPRLLRAMQDSTVHGLRCVVSEEEVIVYPLETLVVAPELLLSVRVEIITEKCEALEFYCSAHSHFGRLELSKAEAAITQALGMANQSDNVMFLLLLGRILFKIKSQRKRAVEIFQRIHSLAPHFGRCYLRLGEALFESKMYAQCFVVLYRGREYGIFESRAGERLFQLGRNAVREYNGGRLTSQDNPLQNAIDLHVLYQVFKLLPIWDLLAISRVCHRWNFAWNRWRQLQWGAEWEKALRAKFRRRLLFLHGVVGAGLSPVPGNQRVIWGRRNFFFLFFFLLIVTLPIQCLLTLWMKWIRTFPVCGADFCPFWRRMGFRMQIFDIHLSVRLPMVSLVAFTHWRAS